MFNWFEFLAVPDAKLVIYSLKEYTAGYELTEYICLNVVIHAFFFSLFLSFFFRASCLKCCQGCFHSSVVYVMPIGHQTFGHCTMLWIRCLLFLVSNRLPQFDQEIISILKVSLPCHYQYLIALGALS